MADRVNDDIQIGKPFRSHKTHPQSNLRVEHIDTTFLDG